MNALLPPFDHHAAYHRELWMAQTDAMRAEGPVGWTDANGGHWVIVGHEAVREAALNWKVFSAWHDPTGACPYAKGIGIPPFAFPLILSESDPPVSTERRMLEMPFFRPAIIQAREPVVRRHADACLDALAGRPQVDLFRDFAMPVAAKTTMEIVGVDLDRWTEFTLKSHQGGTGPSFDLAADIDRVHAMLLDLVRERRRAPGDDIASALVQGTVAGQPLRDEEALSMLSALVLGGFDTTSSMITGALVWLDDHREAHGRLVADAALMANAADEFLRVTTPSLGGARNLTRDFEFHGRRMAKGQRALLCWAAANRDPTVFEAPHQVRLDRPNAARHVTFGFGPHRCLGADLARLIGRVAIPALLARYPDYKVRRSGLAPYQSPGGFVLGWAAVPATLAGAGHA